MELHFYPPVFIGVNFLASGPGHDGRLRALDDGLGGQARRAERLFRVNGGETAGEEITPVAPGRRGREFARVGMEQNPGNEIFTVLIASRMVLELERAAGSQPARAGLAVEDFVL